MTVVLLELLIVLLGIAATAVLFFRVPTLPEVRQGSGPVPKVSVIIPARNEEHNLPLLLEDLRRQTLCAYEVICVDDASEDNTAQIAASFGVRVISLPEKPAGWTGKPWACQNGADAATGELLLFLDADVRLGRNGLHMLLEAYSDCGCAISVQPYHKTERLYEQLSMFFNLIQIAANGTALPKARDVGLYGPVIAISRKDYTLAGGHESVKKCVVEDMELGLQLKKAGLAYRLFIGGPEVSFRMYSGGLRSLLEGWTKNFAAGAAKTPPLLFLLVFLWTASWISVPLQIVKAIFPIRVPLLILYAVLYAVWVLLLTLLSKKVGRFRQWLVPCYPVLIPVFLGVFAVSMIKRAFGLKVTWKGRKIGTEEKTCV
jgi:4,4'-diaponeurosporenoate glycosyltransferase